MNLKINKWVLFVILSIIWGSSFILMILGQETLSPYQVAAIRIMCAGIVVSPFSITIFNKVAINDLPLILLSGCLGSFFPAYLFCMAEGEGKLDSSFAGMLNALTPLFVLTIGIVFFKLKPTLNQILGITICFIGSILLFISKNGQTGQLIYVGYVFIATIMYGLNVNLVSSKLKHIQSEHLVVLAFSMLCIPSAIILYFTGFFNLHFTPAIWKSVYASAFLGISSTTVASFLFYYLMRREGAVFSSSITYAIPFVSIVIGYFYGEQNNVFVFLSLGVLLGGIYIIGKKKVI